MPPNRNGNYGQGENFNTLVKEHRKLKEIVDEYCRTGSDDIVQLVQNLVEVYSQGGGKRRSTRKSRGRFRRTNKNRAQ